MASQRSQRATNKQVMSLLSLSKDLYAIQSKIYTDYTDYDFYCRLTDLDTTNPFIKLNLPFNAANSNFPPDDQGNPCFMVIDRPEISKALPVEKPWGAWLKDSAAWANHKVDNDALAWHECKVVIRCLPLITHVKSLLALQPFSSELNTNTLEAIEENILRIKRALVLPKQQMLRLDHKLYIADDYVQQIEAIAEYGEKHGATYDRNPTATKNQRKDTKTAFTTSSGKPQFALSTTDFLPEDEPLDVECRSLEFYTSDPAIIEPLHKLQQETRNFVSLVLEKIEQDPEPLRASILQLLKQLKIEITTLQDEGKVRKALDAALKKREQWLQTRAIESYAEKLYGRFEKLYNEMERSNGSLELIAATGVLNAPALSNTSSLSFEPANNDLFADLEEPDSAPLSALSVSSASSALSTQGAQGAASDLTQGQDSELTQELDATAKGKGRGRGGKHRAKLNDGGILHPLLLRRLRLVQDITVGRGRLIIYDNAAHCELYTTVLARFTVNYAVLENEYQSEELYPFDTAVANSFLMRLSNALGFHCHFKENGCSSDPSAIYGDPQACELCGLPVMFVRKKQLALSSAVDKMLEEIQKEDAANSTQSNLDFDEEQSVVPVVVRDLVSLSSMSTFAAESLGADTLGSPAYLDSKSNTAFDTASSSSNSLEHSGKPALSPDFLFEKEADFTANAEFLEQNTPANSFVLAYDHDDQAKLVSQLNRIDGISPQILLTKPANSEQLEIAENIERASAVLVQGPPGTGKTHTIANLLGYFLSQGRTVLVISENSKALRVLKDKVEPRLQDLCISILDESNQDTIHALQGIINKYNEYERNPQHLLEHINYLRIERQKIGSELTTLRTKMVEMEAFENGKFYFNGQQFPAYEFVNYVTEHEAAFAPLLPKIEQELGPCPLTQDELNSLYAINARLKPELKNQLSEVRPDLTKLPSPEKLSRSLSAQNQRKQTLLQAYSQVSHMWHGPWSIKLGQQQLIFERPDQRSVSITPTLTVLQKLKPVDNLVKQNCLNSPALMLCGMRLGFVHWFCQNSASQDPSSLTGAMSEMSWMRQDQPHIEHIQSLLPLLQKLQRLMQQYAQQFAEQLDHAQFTLLDQDDSSYSQSRDSGIAFNQSRGGRRTHSVPRAVHSSNLRTDKFFGAFEDSTSTSDELTLLLDPEFYQNLRYQLMHLQQALAYQSSEAVQNELHKLSQHLLLNGRAIKLSIECTLALNWMELEREYLRCAQLWDQMCGALGEVRFAQLAEQDNLSMQFSSQFSQQFSSHFRQQSKQVDVALQKIKQLQSGWPWCRQVYLKLRQLTQECGLYLELMYSFDPQQSAAWNFKQLLEGCYVRLPAVLRLLGVQNAWLQLDVPYQRFCRELEQDLELKKQESPQARFNLYSMLLKALHQKNTAAYNALYQNISVLENFHPNHQTYHTLLHKLAAVDPKWADLIAQRRGIHALAQPPAQILEAWQWRNFACKLKSMDGSAPQDLNARLNALSLRYRSVTTDYAAARAWFLMLSKLDSSKVKSLRKAADLLEKIGTGTSQSKRMLSRKRDLKQTLEECMLAIPVWIMPLHKVFENFAVGHDKFDVLIVDEASQVPLYGIAALFMARKSIIVGDDKQVSPRVVGISLEAQEAIKAKYRQDIPTYSAFDMEASLYDLAKVNYSTVMLREHFRCVPEIINFCNHLAYHNQIKPLRDAGSTSLQPAMVNYVVDEAVHIPKTITGRAIGAESGNFLEALHITALLYACMHSPYYAGKTFGVVVMLGTAQIEIIESLISRYIPLKDQSRCQLRCGNAPDFQGDERDVIFLSLVASNSKEDGPLILQNSETRKSLAQNYNVAVSRARDQLWVVSSIDKERDLQNRDIRYQLISYAQDPDSFMRNQDLVDLEIANKSDSPFEKEVATFLINQGYRIRQQYPVGSYRIDMVVFYHETKVALECDGEAYHSSPEQVRHDLERQTILERLGWRFVRLRGSRYFRNKEQALQNMCLQLKSLGVVPERPAFAPEASAFNSELSSTFNSADALDFTSDNSAGRDMLANSFSDASSTTSQTSSLAQAMKRHSPVVDAVIKDAHALIVSWQDPQWLTYQERLRQHETWSAVNKADTLNKVDSLNNTVNLEQTDGTELERLTNEALQQLQSQAEQQLTELEEQAKDSEAETDMADTYESESDVAETNRAESVNAEADKSADSEKEQTVENKTETIEVVAESKSNTINTIATTETTDTTTVTDTVEAAKTEVNHTDADEAVIDDANAKIDMAETNITATTETSKADKSVNDEVNAAKDITEAVNVETDNLVDDKAEIKTDIDSNSVNSVNSVNAETEKSADDKKHVAMTAKSELPDELEVQAAESKAETVKSEYETIEFESYKTRAEMDVSDEAEMVEAESDNTVADADV